MLRGCYSQLTLSMPKLGNRPEGGAQSGHLNRPENIQPYPTADDTVGRPIQPLEKLTPRASPEDVLAAAAAPAAKTIYLARRCR